MIDESSSLTNRVYAAEQCFPLITVGITCYNAEATIERAINSALAQEWPNYEIIIVDDCSVDKSLEVVETMISDSGKVEVIVLPENKGVAAARNTILKHTNGEFIAFFDDDDESDPRRLVRQYERITEYESKTGSELVICHTARLQLLPDGGQRYEPTIGVFDGVVPHATAVAEQILIGRPIGEPVASCATCSQMARKSVYEKVGGFTETLRRSEDTDINVRFALEGAHFTGIEYPLVKQHLTFTPEKNINEERHFALLWLENHRDYLEKIGWYTHAREWLDIKYDYLCGQKKRFLFRMFILFVKSPWRTLLRLYWVWPNRQYSKLVLNWHDKYFDANSLR